MDPILLGSDEEMEEVALPATSTNEPQQVRTTRRKLHRMKLMPGAQSPGRESVLSQDSQEPIEESGDGATATGSLEEDETTQLALSQLAELPDENGGVEGGVGFDGLEQQLPSSNDALLDDGGGDEGEGGLVVNEEDADRLLDGHTDSGIQEPIISSQPDGQSEEIAESPLYTGTFAADDEIQFLSSNITVRPSTPPYMKEEGENSPGGGVDEETEDDECMIIGQVGPVNKPALLVKHEPRPPLAVYQSPQVITLTEDGEDEGRGTAGSTENDAAQNRHSSTDDLSSDEDDAPLSVRSETGEDEGVNAAMEKEREEHLQLLVAEQAPPQRIDPWDAVDQLQQHEPQAVSNPEAERMDRIMTEAMMESQVGRESEGDASTSATQSAEVQIHESPETQQGKVVVGRQKINQPKAVSQPLRARPRHRQTLKKGPVAIVELDDTAEMSSTDHLLDISNEEIKTEPSDPMNDNAAAVDYSEANLEEPLDPANMNLIDSVDMEICHTPTIAEGSEQQPASPTRSGVEMEVEDGAPRSDQPTRRSSGFGGGIDSATIQQLRANHYPPSFPERSGLDVPLLLHHQSLSSPPRLANMMPAGGSTSEEVPPGEAIPTLNTRRQSRLGQRTSPLGRAQVTQIAPFFDPSFQQQVGNIQQLWTGQPLRMPFVPVGGADFHHRPPSPVDFSHPPPIRFDAARPPPGVLPPVMGGVGGGGFQLNTHAARYLLERRGMQVGPNGVVGGGVEQPIRPLRDARSRSTVRFQDEDAIAQEEFDSMPEMSVGGYQSDAGHRSNFHRTPSRGRRSVTPFRFPISPREIADRHSGDEEIHRARSRSRPRVQTSGGGRSRSRQRVPSGSGVPLTGANTEPQYFDAALGTVRGEYDAVTLRNLNRMCGRRLHDSLAPAVGQIPHGVDTSPQYTRRTPRRPQRDGSDSSSGGGFSPRRQRERSPSPYRGGAVRRPRGMSETRRGRRMSPSPVRRQRPAVMRSRSRRRRSPVGARTSRERVPHGSRPSEHHSRPRRSDPTDRRRKRHLSGFSDDGSVSSSDTDSVSSAELRRRMNATEVDIKLYKAMKVKEALARKIAKREKRAERETRSQDNGGVQGGEAAGSTDRDGAQRAGPSRHINGGRPPSPKRRSTGDGNGETAQPTLLHEMRVAEVSDDGDDDCVIIPPCPVLIKQETPDDIFARRGRVTRPLTAAELDQRLEEYRASSSQATTVRVDAELASGLEQQTL